PRPRDPSVETAARTARSRPSPTPNSVRGGGLRAFTAAVSTDGLQVGLKYQGGRRMLDNLARRREGRTRRRSRWDTRGREHDAWPIEGGETKTLADLRGAGVIRHLWFTISAEDPFYLRQCVLRIYWDGQTNPSVETPVGDFFGVGHGKVSSYSCAVFNMSAN